MNNKALSLSVLMAIIAVFMVQSYVSSIEEETQKKFGTEVLVVKARRDIKEMETINETMVQAELIPNRFLEPAAIYYETNKVKDKEIQKSIKDLAGMVAIVPIKKNEQVTFNKIMEPSIRTGLAPQIAPGRRAISVPVNDVTGVSKLVKPGDRVDLIAVLDMGGGRQNKISKTVLQDVVVLSVGKSVTNNIPRIMEADPFGGKERVKSLTEDSSFTSVTLEVEPTQAQALALVMSNGDNAVTLSLRNNDDSDRVTIGSSTLDDVLGADAGRVQRAPGGQRR